jgi:hypothetical protein
MNSLMATLVGSWPGSSTRTCGTSNSTTSPQDGIAVISHLVDVWDHLRYLTQIQSNLNLRYLMHKEIIFFTLCISNSNSIGLVVPQMVPQVCKMDLMQQSRWRCVLQEIVHEADGRQTTGRQIVITVWSFILTQGCNRSSCH